MIESYINLIQEKKVDLNNSNSKINEDKKENFDDFEIIDNNFDEEKEELKRNKILEEMRKSIFFNDYSKTFKNVERKINEIREKILNESNTHLIPLLSAKKDLIRLFSELRTEFRHFLSEDKMRKHFPALNEISEINLDENSIGLIIETIICFLSIIAIGTTGTVSLAFGLPIYIFTKNKKKDNIEKLLRENANRMFKEFKEVSIDDYSIKRAAEEYNKITDQFISYSKYFDDEHENDIDLLN